MEEADHATKELDREKLLTKIESMIRELCDSQDITLFKYSLDENLREIESGTSNFIIKFPMRKTNPRLQPCIFLSINGDLDTFDSHDNLALTYYPKARYELLLNPCDFVFEDNIGGRIKNFESPPLRCWPAFGQIGGSREVILVDNNNSLKLPASSPDILPGGGEVDKYHQDNTANYDLVLAQQLVRIIIEVLENSDETLGNNGRENTTIGKFTKASGLSVNIRLRNGRFISISSGFFNYCGTTEINIWAALWEDDERQGKRYIYGPFEENVIFPISNFTFVMQSQTIESEHNEGVINNLSLQFPLCELNTKIKGMLSRLLRVTDSFFFRYSNSFLLKNK